MFNFIIPLMMAVIIFPAFAWSDEFRLVPSMSVKQEYNSNTQFTTNGAIADYITTLSPGVEMFDSTGRFDTDLSVHLDRLEFAKTGALDATNQMYDAKFRYAATPLLNISAEGGYTKNSNPTLNIGATGIISAAAPFNHIASSLAADYRVSEKTSVSLSYKYADDYYDDPRFPGDMTHDINAGLGYDLGEYLPTLKGGINAGYSRYSHPDSLTDIVAGGGGLSANLNELWGISLNGGIQRSSNELTVTNPVPGGAGTEKLKDSALGWDATASLNYTGERSSGALAFTRGIVPALSFNEAAEQTAVTFSARQQLTYEISALLSSGYYIVKPLSSATPSQTADQHTYQVNPGIRYEFSKSPLKFFDRGKEISVDVSYGYTRTDYPSSHTRADRHDFMFTLTIQHPFFD